MSYQDYQSRREEGHPIKLYEFKIGTYAYADPAGYLDNPAQRGEAVYRYCDADRDMVINGHNWEAIPVSDKGMTITGESSAEGYEVTMPSKVHFASLFRTSPPAQTVALFVYEYHYTDPAKEVRVIWVGEVAEARWAAQREAVVFASNTLSTAFNRTGLRLTWTRNCPHMLYDEQCGLKMRNFITDVTVMTIVSADHVVIDTEAPNSLFAGGILMWTNEQEMFEDAVGIEATNDANLVRIFGLTDRMPGAIGGPFGAEQGSFNNVVTPRFAAKFWTVDGPRTMSFGATTAGNSLRVDFTARMKNDLCGLIWTSADTLDHRRLCYQTKKDYRGMVWDFDLQVGGGSPGIGDPVKAISMTINGRDAAGNPAQWIIALFRYGVSYGGDPRYGHFTINFDDLRAGFFADQPVYTGDIDSFFISCVTNSYETAAAGVFLPVNETSFLIMSNLAVSGANSQMNVGVGNVPAHSLGLATSYDDHYNQTPERILSNMYTLGYRGMINHYCGMSVFPEKEFDAGVGRLLIPSPAQIDAGKNPVNLATRTWHTDFAARASALGYEMKYSVSYETYSEFTNWNYVQKDWDDNPGATGYIPPSFLISPCSVDGMGYLRRCFISMANVMAGAGIPIRMQVGEPWWWMQIANSKPCVYDFETKVKFNAETGLFAPNLGTAFDVHADATSLSFIAFLKKELGLSVQSCRAAVKAIYPAAEFSHLAFLPTIEGSWLGQRINRPDAHYSYPNFEECDSEAYDWIIFNQMDQVIKAVTIPRDIWGFPPAKIKYLAGFVPEGQTVPVGAPPFTRRSLWTRIFTHIHDFEQYGLGKQHIWAYTIAMKDSITYRETPTIRAFFMNGTYNQVFPPLVGTFPARIARGCARTMAACQSFGNQDNYGGCPHLPEKTPFSANPMF